MAPPHGGEKISPGRIFPPRSLALHAAIAAGVLHLPFRSLPACYSLRPRPSRHRHATPSRCMSLPLRTPSWPEADADLLAPTLTEADDLTGFSAPWNPQMVTVLVLLSGPLAGGVLLALNFRRLGLPQHAPRALWTFSLLALATTAPYGWLYVAGHWPEPPPHRGTIAFARNLAALVLALFLVRPQKPRFRLWQACGREPASLLGPGLLAFVLGNAATFGLLMLAVAIAVKLR